MIKHDEDEIANIANDYQHDYGVDNNGHYALTVCMRDYHEHMKAKEENNDVMDCIEYIVSNRVKFRYEGERNEMAWWDDKGNQGRELRSLADLVCGAGAGIEISKRAG